MRSTSFSGLVFCMLVSCAISGVPTSSDSSPPSVPDDAHWWDGFSDINRTGLWQPAEALTLYHGEIVAGGEFWYAGDSVAASYVARWDGTSWHALGRGLDSRPIGNNYPWVWGLVEFRGDLVATGRFEFCNGYVGGTPANNIARWDGTRWHPLGGGLNRYGQRLIVYNNDLIVLGAFTEVDNGISAVGIARWDGAQWHSMGSEVSGPDDAIIYHGDLVVAPAGIAIGERSYIGVARWNGVEWSAIGTRAADFETGIVAYHDTLIAQMVYGPPDYPYTINLLSKWDGVAWVPLGSVSPIHLDVPRRFAVYNDRLYVGGTFGGPAGNLNNIARWNGVTFEPLGSGLPYNDRGLVVCDFLVFDRSLYVSGTFDTAGGKPSWYIARWDDDITPVTIEDLAAEAHDGVVQVRWRIPPEGLSNLGSVSVQRASDRPGPYAVVSEMSLLPEREMSFTDLKTEGAHAYWYRLRLLEKDGGESVAGPVFVSTQELAAATVLYTPFVPGDGSPVVIRYRIGSSSVPLALEIFTVQGRLVRTLERAAVGPGEHLRYWDRHDEGGYGVGRGVYFVRLSGQGMSNSKKFVLPSR